MEFKPVIKVDLKKVSKVNDLFNEYKTTRSSDFDKIESFSQGLSKRKPLDLEALLDSLEEEEEEEADDREDTPDCDEEYISDDEENDVYDALPILRRQQGKRFKTFELAAFYG